MKIRHSPFQTHLWIGKYSDYNVYVGLDIHKETIVVAIADSGRSGEVRFWGNIINRPVNIRHLFNKLLKKHTDILVCYEAGCCGYGIYRQLTSWTLTAWLLLRQDGLNHRLIVLKMITVMPLHWLGYYVRGN